MTSYIYVTYHKKTLKPYVGQHTWRGKGHDINYYGSGVAIRKALEGGGKENFSNHVIEYCDSVAELNEKEQYWITELDSMSPNGYNLIYGGLKVKGCRHSLETRERMSRSHKGKKHTVESREKMSKAQKGREVSEETRTLLSHALSGKKPSQETRTKMSETRLGVPIHSKEFKENQSENMKNNTYWVGRKHLEASKRKIGLANTGRIPSSETRKKMSQSAKTRPKVCCPHCGKIGDGNIMKRWHFENCKLLV